MSSKLKLTLSSKGQLVCSDKMLGTLLAKLLRRKGILVTYVYQARDSGVVNAAGKPAHRCGVGERISNSRQRVKAIRRIAKISPMARRLYSGSAYSVATWGHITRMLSTSTLAQLGRDAANASGIKVVGRNLFMTNLVTYGKYTHSVTRLYADMVQSQFSVLATIIDTDITIIQFRKAWAKVYTEVQAAHQKSSRWTLNSSTGPIYVILNMLLSHGL